MINAVREFLKEDVIHETTVEQCRNHDVRTCADHGDERKRIEQHYGTLIDTAHGAILTPLERCGTP